ncbi:hypothetical protein [Sphaerospermopsis sp. FACHB-1194]|uniref:hypothetical protein n=1 Tax=Sphaerospermopsis sp. FACHB-1194 TaxID=2692862 RepID=UPI0016803770|nr:hypothetical protein [Sphaerospermopsis sp. FACHB-1194]MBD2146989.1 hypothetical protein [Sphaerospermopsis sp. FACHB-1194]
MDTSYWQYFLALEQDLNKFSRYVEFSENNYNTYSIEFTRIYLSVCSEIDVVAKILSNNLGNPNAKNICDYKHTILATYPNLPNLDIQIPRYSLSLTPWSDWSSCDSPTWWQKYNKVKHQRDQYYHEANLQNVLNAVAGLLVMNLYYLKQQSSSSTGRSDIQMDYEMRSILLIPVRFKREVLVNGYITWEGKIP